MVPTDPVMDTPTTSPSGRLPEPPWHHDHEGRVHLAATTGMSLASLPSYVRGAEPAMRFFGTMTITPVTLGILGGSVAWACAAMLQHAGVLPGGTPYVVLGACVLAGGWVGIRAVRRSREARSALGHGLALSPDPVYRVRCVGGPASIASLGRLVPGVFEPELFDASLAHGGMPGSWVGRAVTVVAGIGLVGVAFRLATGYWLFATQGMAMAYGVVMLGAMVGGLVSSVLWPVYYRVSPGRLDQVSTGFLARGPVKTRSWNLRECGVLVNLANRCVVIDPPGSARLILSGAMLGRRHDFERAVLLGALATPTAELDEALPER